MWNGKNKTMSKNGLLKFLRSEYQMPESEYDEGYNDGIALSVKNIECLDVPENYHKLNENNKEVINRVINCLVESQIRKEKQNAGNQICPKGLVGGTD